MSRIITTLALVASASAFTAPAPQARAASMVGALSDYAGVSFETGDAVWDPLGFGSMSEKIKGGEHDSVMPDAKWLREAELKHCRGAMLAFVGTCVAVNGITFPGELGGYHYEAGTWYEGLSNAMATNTFGMAQLFLSIGLVEGASFCGDFWTGGGDREAGDLGFTPFGKKSGVELDTLKLQELKNGRLAMIAMAAFFAEHQIDGSVPFLTDNI